jgi:hypothetical protein
MKKIEFIAEKSYKCFILPNGKIMNLFPFRWDAKIELESEMYISSDDTEEYEASTLPTIQDLVEQNVIKISTCIRNEHTITFSPRKRVLTKKDIKNIIKEFAENNLSVSEEAIINNYECWLGDLKSGFRDEKNGTHLFTPCRCNPLQFYATTLENHPTCDWQTTYEW